ncbi:hypothetical protein NH340_JMT07396 [Sarcoptes scabiei]|nr:hypothetical protein NH340_JMT07396 [Sarcoptes scabiei]
MASEIIAEKFDRINLTENSMIAKGINSSDGSEPKSIDHRHKPGQHRKSFQRKPHQLITLREKSLKWNTSIESKDFARLMDEEDPFRSFRKMFSFPKKCDLPNVDRNLVKNCDEECIYLCGQSLGLKPKHLDQNVQKVLDNWAQKGVHSHFHGYLPAALSDLPGKKPMAKLVGAQEHEIAILNGLTVNLHLLLATFYRPDSQRFKLIIEDHAFPSDTYVVKSQIQSHGLRPEDALIAWKPRKGEYLLNEDDIINIIEEQGDQIKVALFPAVQYYTGQLVDVRRLTEAAQKKGIIVGVDLAHAAGNVPIYLDEWNVDFAAWCTYKYMNSGAGCIGGIYINDRFLSQHSSTFPMYQGWWGNNVRTKFLMKEDFDPAIGADMFKLSNPPPVLNAMLMSSLEIFEKTSIEELRKKQVLLTGYLEILIKHYFPSSDEVSRKNCERDRSLPTVTIITPSDPNKRGAQLSLIFSVPLSFIHEQFQKRGIVCDIRMPSVMRVAPTPLYNSFQDVHEFVTILFDIFQNREEFVDCSSDSETSWIDETYEIADGSQQQGQLLDEQNEQQRNLSQISSDLDSVDFIDTNSNTL